MDETVLLVLLLAAIVNTGLLVVVLVRALRSRGSEADPVHTELRAAREEASQAARETREELSGGLERANETLTRQLKELAESNEVSLARIRDTMDSRVKTLQEGNEQKLDEMRKTVDEKLHSTLEKRLGESFKIVGDQLEAVHKGLGEMQNLATGVGDLKRVLTNVKARGTWAEVQLGALLEQILAASQFERNVRVKEDSREVVEFAVRLPGAGDEPDSCVWLPIDSKFPQEDYLRILEAAEAGDPKGAQKATEDLARAVKVAAQDIRDKYVCPPCTTDFAIMFLATEGLYAEVLRQPALVEELQTTYRIVVAGPTSLAALLSSLRMGFQTLAIEQRAVEVWEVLAAVKTEFGKFGDVLDKLQRQLDTAQKTIEQTGVRKRAMEKKLRDVEQLPSAQASQVLELPETLAEVASDEAEDASG